MRAFLDRNKWATTLVAALFMLATSGISLSRMTCSDGGHSVVSLGRTAGCCPEEAPHGETPEVKPACCELALVQGERDNYLPNSGFDLLAEDVVLHHIIIEFAAPVRTTPVTWLGSRPPPLSAPDRLSVLSIQRV